MDSSKFDSLRTKRAIFMRFRVPLLCGVRAGRNDNSISGFAVPIDLFLVGAQQPLFHFCSRGMGENRGKRGRLPKTSASMERARLS